MAEKQGQKGKVNPKVVEETENAKIFKTLIEMNGKMQKMTEDAQENAQQIRLIFDQMKDLKSDVKEVAGSIGQLQKRETEFQLEITKLNDLIKVKDMKILELRQGLERKIQKIEKMESKLNSLVAIVKGKSDPKLLNTSVEQLRATSDFYIKSISEQIQKIEDVCRTTTEQLQLKVAEDDLQQPELKAVLTPGQVMKQTIQIQDDKKLEQLDNISGQWEDFVVETRQVMKQTIQQKEDQIYYENYY